MDVDITRTIPSAELSPALRKLITQRDKAVETLDDFEADNYEILADNWLTNAEAADVLAAVDAVANGQDAFALPSAVEAAQVRRPKALGVRQALAAELRQADIAVARAYRTEAASLAPKAMDELRGAVTDAQSAYAAFLAACAAVSAAGSKVRHLRDWAEGGRSDYSPTVGALADADGFTVNTGNPQQDLLHVLNSFEAPTTADPMVDVRSANGAVISIPQSRALALAESANSGVTADDISEA
ncbi:hypothetical protein [Streptomyces sp. enrichment culture]|uniref:hypothetical protein n=1 Tax=Streptomyces sp. enrichment culture TaxID=1795815 RepID=UPI003F56B45A